MLMLVLVLVQVVLLRHHRYLTIVSLGENLIPGLGRRVRTIG